MTLAAFVSAVLALLLAPGPTNTLMALAGAQRGPRQVLRLLPAELSGYLTTILPLVWLGPQLLDRVPALAISLKLAAAVWVMVLAVRLWSAPGPAQGASGVSARGIYLTTVLNPKALIFGLVLLPPFQDAAFAPRLGLFCLLVGAVALLWGAAGSLISAGGARRLAVMQRVASVWLALVAVTLLAGAVTA